MFGSQVLLNTLGSVSLTQAIQHSRNKPRSGLQKQVLGLYRRYCRAIRAKDLPPEHVRRCFSCHTLVYPYSTPKKSLRLPHRSARLLSTCVRRCAEPQLPSPASSLCLSLCLCVSASLCLCVVSLCRVSVSLCLCVAVSLYLCVSASLRLCVTYILPRSRYCGLP